MPLGRLLATPGEQPVGLQMGRSERLGGLLARAVGVGLEPGGGVGGGVLDLLGLGAGGAEDVLGFLLGRRHAVLRGAIGLGDPLLGACLGLGAELGGGVFGGADDAGDAAGGGAQGIRLAIARELLLLKAVFVHEAIVNRLRAARTASEACSRHRSGAATGGLATMAGYVGNTALRTDRAWRMIESWPAARPPARS